MTISSTEPPRRWFTYACSVATSVGERLRAMARAIVADAAERAATLEAAADELDRGNADESIDTDNCSQLVGLSPRAFSDAGRRGHFPAWKAGNKLTSRRADVVAWLETRRVKPRTPVVVEVTASSSPDDAAHAEFEIALRSLYKRLDRGETGVTLSESECAPMRKLIARYGVIAVAHRQQLTAATMNELVSRVPRPTAEEQKREDAVRRSNATRAANKRAKAAAK